MQISTLIKEDIDFWKEDVRPDNNESEFTALLNSELGKIKEDIDVCMLNADAVQVSAVIAGYAARKVVVEGSECVDCKAWPT